MTDPRLFAGIGNAYSDEILHRARLSPVALTFSLSGEEATRLFHATRDTLVDWTDTLRMQAKGNLPEKVTGRRVLADRSLSRLLKKSWPRSIDELE